MEVLTLVIEKISKRRNSGVGVGELPFMRKGVGLKVARVGNSGAAAGKNLLCWVE
jgi:hypothetical protein